METVHDGTPLAAYLEGAGSLEPDLTDSSARNKSDSDAVEDEKSAIQTFAPPNDVDGIVIARKTLLPLRQTPSQPQSSLSRVHNALSTAVNSRLGRADNARFIEHFRYVIVASQLLNEYLDHGALQQIQAPAQSVNGASDNSGVSAITASLCGAAAVAAAAFTLVYLLHWARNGRNGVVSKSRVVLVLAIFAAVASVGYALIRRQWLRSLRRHAVTSASTLTANWQAFEVSTGSALSLIQEVELVSKGYRVSTPLPPASRIEERGSLRRCGRLRKALYKSYTGAVSTCIDACNALRTVIDEDDLEKYFEVYDVNAQDARECSGADELSAQEDDPESLKSLRLLSYRAGVLRRVMLCSLMALEADGGQPDFHCWRLASDAMDSVNIAIASSVERLTQVLGEMETLTVPHTPIKSSHTPNREKMRSQVRKISMLSSGIRGLQAKMQILREETNRSIEQQEDLTDLGPSLMAQYESIGADLKDLMQAWEAGKTSLQTNITKQERRISMTSSSLMSPVSSVGGSLSGLTAVEEGGTPADALKALNGDTLSNRSSMATTPSDDEVFEAIALPRQRSMLTRNERILKMKEERERQATVRAKRESNTNMLRELESVLSLRPNKPGATRITSV